MNDDRGFRTRRLKWCDEVLAEVALPRKILTVTRGLGSGLARRAGDPPGTFWAIGDRGPNFKVKVAIKRYGVDGLSGLKDIDGAKIMPFVEHGPELAQLRIERDRVVLLRTLPLIGGDGARLTGLPVPASVQAENEPIFSLDGTPLGTDPSGLDSEGVAALADGGFWVGDEYGPSLLRLDPDGRVIHRWVPLDSHAHYDGATYPVIPVLPALASARRLNRGFEAVALSPDERSLYLAFQSPLAHPDRAAHEASRHVRIWQLDAATGAMEAEFVYPLDPPHMFRRDFELSEFRQSDVKVSELVTLGERRMLVLERGSASTRMYRVDLSPDCAVPPNLLDPPARPTLEQMDDDAMAAAGVRPLAKTLVLDTDLAPEIPPDLEGCILLSPRELLLVNDNDFGVEGVATEFWRVTFDEDL